MNTRHFQGMFVVLERPLSWRIIAKPFRLAIPSRFIPELFEAHAALGLDLWESEASARERFTQIEFQLRKALGDL